MRGRWEIINQNNNNIKLLKTLLIKTILRNPHHPKRPTTRKKPLHLHNTNSTNKSSTPSRPTRSKSLLDVTLIKYFNNTIPRNRRSLTERTKSQQGGGSEKLVLKSCIWTRRTMLRGGVGLLILELVKGV